MRKKDPFRSVLIFGGAGFIGANWAGHLLERTAAKVHVFDNLSRPGVRHNLAWLQELAGGSGRLKITVGDIRDAAMVERAVRTATEIYHFAAQVAVTTSVLDPRRDFEINLAGTFNVLEAVRKAGHQPFLLFTSTNKVYGEIRNRSLRETLTRFEYEQPVGIAESQPLDLHSPYGCSKGAADQYVLDYARIYQVPAVVFRMSCIAGPRQFGNEDQGWMAHFLYSALGGNPLLLYGDGRQVRDVLYIGDLLRAFELVREQERLCAGKAYNVGGGMANTTSLLELIALIEHVTGKRITYALDERRPGDQLVYVTDFSRLEKDTGWRPATSIGETLESMHSWWKRNRELFVAPAVADRAAVAPVGLAEVSRIIA